MQSPKNTIFSKFVHKAAPVLVSAVAFCCIGLPAQAGVIDQVKDKVDAVKRDTNAIKSKTGNIQNNVAHIGNATNALIQETFDIRTLVEPLEMLRQMKDQFAGGGFDPAELLEIVDTEELRSHIDRLKQERDEIRAAMNDPNLEAYRAQLLSTLEGMNALVSSNGIPAPSPLQTMVENAPTKLLAMMKIVTESGVLEEMNALVQQSTDFYTEHADELAVAQWGFEALTGHYCGISETIRKRRLFSLIDQEHRWNQLITRMELLKLKFGEKLDKTQELAIHGYVGVEINIGKRTNKSIEYYTRKFRDRANDVRKRKEKLNFLLLNNECA